MSRSKVSVSEIDQSQIEFQELQSPEIISTNSLDRWLQVRQDLEQLEALRRELEPQAIAEAESILQMVDKTTGECYRTRSGIVSVSRRSVPSPDCEAIEFEIEVEQKRLLQNPNIKSKVENLDGLIAEYESELEILKAQREQLLSNTEVFRLKAELKQAQKAGSKVVLSYKAPKSLI